jgi:hypothetical protein
MSARHPRSNVKAGNETKQVMGHGISRQPDFGMQALRVLNVIVSVDVMVDGSASKGPALQQERATTSQVRFFFFAAVH